ncbi:hypothetical protein PR048_025251 [Dryococelus australis]|uniref:Uncharacterized protein n=1 Tax=Dryococelus australis TaxID=614101 RepID=A0ABQ9GQW2_9NEOP|nr:hypothetical protein PR048_025251 [Dryococelus australis]
MQHGSNRICQAIASVDVASNTRRAHTANRRAANHQQSVFATNTKEFGTLVWTFRGMLVFNSPQTVSMEWSKEDIHIAVIVGQEEAECRRKIIILLSPYRHEKAKEKNLTGIGKGTLELYTNRWFGYEAFRFLENRDKPQPRMDTVRWM